MKAASLSEIKQELTSLPSKKVLELCLTLARYKKDNKELLTYLLFEAHDVQGFADRVKLEIDEHFLDLPKTTWYHTKKSLRKIVRLITKYSRYTGSGEPAIEMLLYFCIKLRASRISFKRNQVLQNIYEQQLKKINTMLEGIHEDLRHDYKRQLQQLILD
jgi:hypothetical protein